MTTANERAAVKEALRAEIEGQFPPSLVGRVRVRVNLDKTGLTARSVTVRLLPTKGRVGGEVETPPESP